jgi:hypothetical protein
MKLKGFKTALLPQALNFRAEFKQFVGIGTRVRIVPEQPPFSPRTLLQGSEK